MTRFVTWDMEDRGGSSTLYRLLPTPKKMVEIYSIAVDKRQKELEKCEIHSFALSSCTNASLFLKV